MLLSFIHLHKNKLYKILLYGNTAELIPMTLVLLLLLAKLPYQAQEQSKKLLWQKVQIPHWSVTIARQVYDSST
jgi:hypothetical protein